MKKILETNRLILREYVQDDFTNLEQIISDPETMKFYPKPYDKKGVQRWLDFSFYHYQKYGFGWWVLENKETGEFIGDCGITIQDIDGEMLPEIGYHLNKKYWRQGYAKEAASAVRDWLYNNTNYDAAYSYMVKANDASVNTASSIGLKRIKEFEEDGVIYCVYRLTREDWINNKK